MTLQITRRDIQDAIGFVTGQKAKYAEHAPGETTAGAFAAQAISGVTAFGYGMIEGRFGPVMVGRHLSADLLGAALLHGLGLLGWAGRMQFATHSAAQGLLDGYAHRLGIGVGTKMGLGAGAPSRPVLASGASVAGSFHAETESDRRSPESRGPITEGEIVALVERSREAHP